MTQPTPVQPTSDQTSLASANTPIRVLVLGATGKVARMLRACWHDRPMQAAEVFWQSRRPGDPSCLHWEPGEAVSSLPRVDAIVALWGVIGGDPSALAQNRTLAIEAMRLGRALGARRVLHCSSAAVYRPGPKALDEAAPCEPIGAYGQAKLAMERAITDAVTVEDAQQVVMRIGNVAGAESLFANLTPGGRLRLDQFGDGNGPARSYIAPPDLARVIEALARAPDISGPINIGAPRPTSMEAIALAAGCEVDWTPAPDTAIPMLALATARLNGVCPLGPEASDPAVLVAGARIGGVWP